MLELLLNNFWQRQLRSNRECITVQIPDPVRDNVDTFLCYGQMQYFNLG